MSEIGDRFQQETKYYRGEMGGHGLDYSRRYEAYKRYAQSKRIALPKVSQPAAGTLHDALVRRRSTRRFAEDPISAEALSYLLWASTGISHVDGGYEFRTAPSAGALYPIETYVCAINVEDITGGIYHYAIREHELELVQKGDFAAQVARAALDQEMCSRAGAVFIWTAVFERSKWKYRQRAYRYVYLDAGHIAENLALAAAGLGVGACHIAAIYDDEANELLDVDGDNESVIYMTAVGQFRQQA